MSKSSFKYYGGNEILDPEIINDIILNKNNDTEEIDFSNSILSCQFKNYTDNIRLVSKFKSRNDENGVAAGGEGVIYETSIPNLVAKIYYESKRLSFREKKITLMVNNPVDDKSICWPKGILRYNGKFVGFVMPRFDSNQYITINPQDVGRSGMPDLFKDNKINMVKLLINISEVFDKLKSLNIVIGDFNFENILVNKDNYNIVLIDMDSAQIDKYPCVTCLENFVAPELFKDLELDDEAMADLNEAAIALPYYNKYYSNFLRDNYSLAFYSFYLLLYRKPYLNNIKKSKLEFGFDLYDEEKTINNIRAKEYNNNWAHLPFFVKEAFYKTFTAKNPGERYTPKMWLKVFKYYLELLENGELQKRDSEYLTIYPLDSKLSYEVLKDLKMLYEPQNFIVSSFSFYTGLKKINKTLKKNRVDYKLDIDLLTEYFKYNNVFKVNENLSIELLMNIGVLKKIRARFTSSSNRD